MNDESGTQESRNGRSSLWPMLIIIALVAGIGIGYAVRKSAIDNRQSPIEAAATPAPMPAFTPDPQVLAMVNAALSEKPWLEAKSSDESRPAGTNPTTTFLVSRVEPVITREGDGWKITFKGKE